MRERIHIVLTTLAIAATAAIVWGGNSAINSGHLGATSTAQTQILDVTPFMFGRAASDTSYISGFLSGFYDQLNGATHEIAVIFAAEKDGSISTIGFRTGTVTTGCTLDVRIETINASGQPSNTLWATNTNASLVVANTDDNIWKEVDLTAAATVSQGDFVAVVFDVASGTPSGLQFVSNYDDANANREFPAVLQYNGSAWNNASSSLCVGALDSSGYNHLFQFCWPIDNVSQTAYSSSTTPDHVGNAFVMPVTARYAGFWAWSYLKSGDVKLIDSDGVTVLSSQPVDVTDNPGTTLYEGRFYAAPEVILTKGETYRLVYVPDSTAALDYVNWWTVDDAKWAGNPLNGGTAWLKWTTAKDPAGTGDWTDDTTKGAFLSPRFNGIESGGAGFSSHIIIE